MAWLLSLNLFHAWIQWTGEGVEWFVPTVADQRPHRFSINGADDLHGSAVNAFGLARLCRLSLHERQHFECLPCPYEKWMD